MCVYICTCIYFLIMMAECIHLSIQFESSPALPLSFHPQPPQHDHQVWLFPLVYVAVVGMLFGIFSQVSFYLYIYRERDRERVCVCISIFFLYDYSSNNIIIHTPQINHLNGASIASAGQGRKQQQQKGEGDSSSKPYSWAAEQVGFHIINMYVYIFKPRTPPPPHAPKQLTQHTRFWINTHSQVRTSANLITTTHPQTEAQWSQHTSYITAYNPVYNKHSSIHIKIIHTHTLSLP